MYTICATGHRPKTLYGYDLRDKRWVALQKKFSELLIEKKCTDAITGMALGVDTVFALAVIDLRDKKKVPINLHCAVPCYNLSEPWFNQADIDRFKYILMMADEVVYVTESDYVSGCLEKRNRYMVDNSDEVLAVWTGASGGTANCIHYAEKQKKPVTNLIDNKGVLL
ncbi:MAG: SLOG family protein [Lachnospiraceae bacterium]|nr:SLOG family protein [Lachnospiraceae bacterium]